MSKQEGALIPFYLKSEIYDPDSADGRTSKKEEI